MSTTSPLLLRPALGLPAYLHHLLRISTVQICRESGYRSSSHAALDSLTSLLHRLIRELGVSARHYAELTGRSEVNLVDVLSALDEYQCDVATLLDYHAHSDQLPFPRPLPNFPLPRPVARVEPPLLPGLSDEGAGGGRKRAAHIPLYLPRWPEERTYKRSEVRPSGELSNADRRHRRIEQNRAVEQALLRIQQAEKQSDSDGADGAAAGSSKRLKVEESRDGGDRKPLSDASTHQPAAAPPPPFPHRERERERTLAKNPYLAPLAPPQPPPPVPMEAESGVEPTATPSSAVHSDWSEAAFASNPPPPTSSAAESGTARTQPAAPPPVADDADIEI